jgi:hypothetical protein
MNKLIMVASLHWPRTGLSPFIHEQQCRAAPWQTRPTTRIHLLSDRRRDPESLYAVVHEPATVAHMRDLPMFTPAGARTDDTLVANLAQRVGLCEQRNISYEKAQHRA